MFRLSGLFDFQPIFGRISSKDKTRPSMAGETQPTK